MPAGFALFPYKDQEQVRGNTKFIALPSFINRFLVKSKSTSVPPDAAKLRVSRAALERLLSALDVPTAFAYALFRYYLPTGRGLSGLSLGTGLASGQLWYFLPIRFQVRCTGSTRCHISSNSGSNQMDPSNYLHLPNQDVDIRGSLIALSFQYNTSPKSASMLAVNFIDGRWPKTVQEPELRIKDIFCSPNQLCLKTDPCFIHLVYIFSAAKWWTNALDSIHDQLIAYVSFETRSVSLGSTCNKFCRNHVSRTMKRSKQPLGCLIKMSTALYTQWRHICIVTHLNSNPWKIP